MSTSPVLLLTRCAAVQCKLTANTAKKSHLVVRQITLIGWPYLKQYHHETKQAYLLISTAKDGWGDPFMKLVSF